MATTDTLALPNMGNTQVNEKTFTEPEDLKSRFLGVSLLITEIGVMIGYGLSGVFRNEVESFLVLRTEINSLILMFLFVTAGFGMLLNIYRFGNWLGTASTLIVLAVSIQLSPLIQKLFISIFLTGFGSVNLNITGSSISRFWNFVTSNNIDVSYILMRITLLSVISILTVMTAVVGRVGTVQIIKFCSLFIIFWSCNFYLLVWFNVIKEDHNTLTFSPYFFDMFGTTYVYLFAVFFGLPFSCMIRAQSLPEVHPRNEFNRLSLLLSQIGSGFIIAAFVFTSCYVVNYQFYGNSIGDNVSRFSILFGIIGSVVGTFVGSALFGQGRVGYKEVLTGTICGGIVMGSAAPLVYNIGILIMIGSVTGFICGIYMRVIHVKINKNNVKDVLGLFGPFCISSIIGSLIVTPSVLATYTNRGIAMPFTNVVPPISLAGYQLIYVGISAGIGLGGGFFTALMGLCDRDYFALASNSRIFLNEFGLFDLGEVSKSRNILPIAGTPMDKVISVAPTPGGANQYYGESQQALNRSGAMI